MPARPVVRALALGALGAAGFVGCTLDWGVRPDPIEAGPPGEVDGAPDGPNIPDVVANDSNDRDAPPIEAGACGPLGGEVDARRKDARICTLGAPNQCADKQMDICCPIFVTKGDSGAAGAFARAVAAFKDAGCDAGCTGCSGLPVTGGCVQSGTNVSCSP
jgi:hypothetical protein